MTNRTPPPVLSRLLTVNPSNGQTGRAYLGREHRPFICYGIHGVTFDPGLFITMRNGLNGVALPSGPFSAFITLVEWGTLDKRINQLPFDACDPSSVGNGSGALLAAFPMFTTAPFLIDLAASYIDVPAFFPGSKNIAVELALVPADAANMAAAGLSLPSSSNESRL